MSFINIILEQAGQVIEETPGTPITPDAPTGGTIDDTADTFGFTLSPGFTLSQHEYSVNGGAYSTVLTNPISVGNINVAIGQLLVRVKAIGINPASATLSNASAFTAVIGDEFHTLAAEKVTDTGYYEAFPMPEQFSFGRRSALWKKSGSHAAKGPLMLSTQGTGAWTAVQVNVGGTLIQSHAHGYCITDTDREIVFYQDDDTFQTVKYATRDGGSGNFTFRGTITKDSWADWIAPCPTKVKRLPQGQYRFAFYQGNNAGTRTAGGFYDSSNNGVTFTFANMLWDRTTQFPASPYTDWMLNEFDFECIENTGTNATSFFIAVCRTVISDEGGTAYTYFTSTGGSTWSQSVTEDAGSFVNDNGATVGGPFSRGLLYRFLSSNSPVFIQLFGSTVYIINGERATTGYKLKYTTNSVAGAKTNVFSGWSATVTLKTYDAATLGGSIDCGYPVLFKPKPSSGGTAQLWGMDYDVSTLTRNPALTEDRCCIQQFQITTP